MTGDMAVPGESPKPGPNTPGPNTPGRSTPGPTPGSNTSAPTHGANTPGPTPNDAAAALAGGAVDPERLRRQVKDVLDAPAPTPAARAEQMERAHALLQDALGGEGASRG